MPAAAAASGVATLTPDDMKALESLPAGATKPAATPG